MPKEARDVGIIAGIFAVLGAVVFIATAALPAQNEPLATSTAIANQVATSTASPQATAFTNIQLTPDEESYLNEIAYQSEDLSYSFYRFADLTSSSSASVDDPNWIAAVKAELDIWHQVFAQAGSMTPPSRFIALHTKYIAALEQYHFAATDIAAGLDNRDTAAMQKGGDELQQGNELITEASDELEKALSSSVFSLQLPASLQVKLKAR
jgi:hypothetical protein